MKCDVFVNESEIIIVFIVDFYIENIFLFISGIFIGFLFFKSRYFSIVIFFIWIIVFYRFIMNF